jgi:hypothetical protein
VAAVGGLLLVVAAVAAAAWHARTPAQPHPAAGDPWAVYTHQWSRLPSPPRAMTGVALAWTGNELVSLGGAIPSIGTPARDGYAFHPGTGRWSHIPPAPSTGRVGAYAVWTGSEVLVIGGSSYAKQPPANVALDPTTNTWRRLPKPPIPLSPHAAKVWTGHALIIWGGGHARSHASRSGAEYVPATNRWHRIAQAPIALKAPSGAWTGSQMIVFGSSIGASYNPDTNTWRQLPPSTLAPDASSIGWIDRRLVAWDYVGNAQDYSPATNRWSATSANPFGFSECSPQTVVTAQVMFAWFCGRAATVGASPDRWATVSGGATAPAIHVGLRGFARYQTASIAPAGAVIAIAATGVVIDHGSPCFGCAGAPVSYWAYRARAGAAVDRAPMRQSVSLHLAAGPQHASVRVVYPRFGDAFTITAAGPIGAAIAGHLEADGRLMSGFECRSVSHVTCRAGPFEGLERGAAPRIWYVHITKLTRAPADVYITVHFRRH